MLEAGRYMGLDLGEKRIGVSLSDAEARLAHPLVTVERVGIKKDLGRIAELMQEHQVLAIVIGLPLNMNGSEGPMALQAREFAKRLKGRVRVPIETWDERLTTVAAERELIEMGMRRDKRRKVIDQVAACHILQSWLDRHRNGGAGGEASE